MEMTLKNNWNSFKIKNLTFDFNEDYFSPVITFDFEVLKSYDYLEKTSFNNIEMQIENNLPYTMLLKEILKECEKIIENTIDK
jgi:hypothetical protein